MASVLVDPDDISYMDDVEDDDVSEGGSDKRHKRRKNRILHEAILINSNEPMVKELRQDRQRLLSGQEDDKGNNTSPSVSMLRELQKDRREALEEKQASHRLDHTDGGVASKVWIIEPTYESLREENAQISEKDKSQESDLSQEAEMISDRLQLLGKECNNDNKYKRKYKSSESLSNHDHSNVSRKDTQVFDDLSKLQAALQKADVRQSGRQAINGNKTNTEVPADVTEEIVKPKQITEAQILMLDEPSTSGASMSEFQTMKENKKKSKGKTKSKNTKEMGGIQIIVTEPQDDSDKSSLKKPNGSVQGKRKGKCKSSKSEDFTEISDNESSGLSGIASLNFLRRLSEQRKSEGTANDLLVKRALYEKNKTRPFKKLAKIKSGLFQVGIEGDAKRSYIKAITIMPDKKLVMFDRNNQCLKLYDNDFNPLDRVTAPVKFCGLAPVFDSTLAATFPEKKQLHFYHIDSRNSSLQRERTQTTSGEYYAIAHYENKLYMLHRQRTPDRFEDDIWSIHKMDLNMGDAEPETLRQFSPGHKDNNLCVNSEGLYMTNKLDGDILHLAHDGTFKVRGRLDGSLPMCITSDSQGNLYVCGGSINSFIEVFKPDLKGSKVIFNKKAQDLVAMCYDKSSNYLYVSDKISGRVLRYKIEHNGFVHGLMRSIVTGSGISC